MESAISLLSGRVEVFAENVDYGDCERNQIVCPECLEPLFKKQREKGAKGQLATHFFCHYPSPGAECMLRIKGEAQDFHTGEAGAEAYGQSVEEFESQFKRLICRGAMKLRVDGQVPGLLDDAWESLDTAEGKRTQLFTAGLSDFALEALGTLERSSATTPIDSALERSQVVQRFLRASPGRHCSLLAGSAGLVVLFGGAFTSWRSLVAHARSQDVEALQRQTAPVIAALVVLYVTPRLEAGLLISLFRKALSTQLRVRTHRRRPEAENEKVRSAGSEGVKASGSRSPWQAHGGVELTTQKTGAGIIWMPSTSDYESAYQSYLENYVRDSAQSGGRPSPVVTPKRSTASSPAEKIVHSSRPSSMYQHTGEQPLEYATPAPGSRINYDEWVEVQGTSIDVARWQNAKQVYSCTRCKTTGELRPVLGLPAPYAGSNGTPASVLPSWCRRCDGPVYGRYPPTITAADENWQYCTLPDAFRGLVGCSDPRRLWYSAMPKTYAEIRVATLRAIDSSVTSTEPKCLVCGSSAIAPLTLNEGSSSLDHSCGGKIIGRFQTE